MSHSPTFFIIAGAQRSGTTYLYNFLDSHPGIQMAKPVKPEPKFFIGDEFKKGKRFYLSKYFKNLESTKVIGEKSTSCLEYSFVPERVLSYFPKAKALISLRNPSERAISNYFFSKNSGLETRSLSEVFLEHKPPPELVKKTSVSPFNYLERGHYSKYLEPYLANFRHNLKIILFEDLVVNPTVREGILCFLEIDKSTDNQYEMRADATNKSSQESSDAKILPIIRQNLNRYYEYEIDKLGKMTNLNLETWLKK